MRCRWSTVVCLAGWLIAQTAGAARGAAGQPMAAAPDFFEKSVRPVLANHCFECHGPQKQKAKLRLDSREAMLKGGESGPAIVPGAPEKSLLIKALRHDDDDLKMPPSGPLAKSDVAALAKWIQQGAHWPQTAREARLAPKASGFKITPDDPAF